MSAPRSKRTPLVTKNTGMKTPNPTASSLRRKSGCVIARSGSASERIAPAANVPRITSSPSCWAAAANPTSSTSAPRTRICAVVSCRRSRSARIRIDRWAPRTTANTASASPSSAPISTSVAPGPPSPAKNSDSRMIAAKSAIEPAAMTSWPSADSILPVSLSTGISTPSDVEPSAMATSSGVSTRPVAAERERDRERDRRATPRSRCSVTPSTRPRNRPKSTSSPPRNSRNASPMVAITSIVASISTQPKPDGPTAMPATISSTTAGMRSPGARPSRNGAANATATTMRRASSEGMRRSPASGQFVTAVTNGAVA